MVSNIRSAHNRDFRQLLWLLPLFVGFVLGILRLDAFQVGAYYDDAWYINTATALARDLGYVRIWTPDLRPETFLPIGYPLILSIIRRIFPDTFTPMLVFSLIAFMGALVVFSKFYQERLGNTLSWFAILLLSVHVGLLGISTMAMAESTYLLLTIVVFVLVEREDAAKKRFLQVLLIAIVATAAYFVRSWGVALVFAIVLYLIKRKQRLSSGFVAIFFTISYALWAWRNARLGGSGASYGLSFTTLIPFLKDLLLNLGNTIKIQWLSNLPNLFVPVLGPQVESFLGRYGLETSLFLIGPGFVIILLIGYLRVVRERVTAVEIYIPLYLGILVIAPPDNRYWLPIFPFLLCYFIKGTDVIFLHLIPQRVQGKWLPYPVLLVLILMATIHLYRDVQAIVQPVRERIPDVAIAGNWLRQNTPQDAIVMALVPRVSYLYSGRTTVPFPDGGDGKRYEIYPELYLLKNEETRARFYETMALFGVDYIVVEPHLASGLPFYWSDYITGTVLPAISEDPNMLLVFEEDENLIRIYKVISDSYQ